MSEETRDQQLDTEETGGVDRIGGADVVDVVVVGGGAAGLSGALALARARRSVVVIDAGEPRNAPAAHLHNYLTRDGTEPGALLALGRDEVASYGGEVRAGQVVSVERRDDGVFLVGLAEGGRLAARRVLLAGGLVDELPAVSGLDERWGVDVLHCPYCHGWEVRDQAIVVLGGPMAVHQALMWRQWSDDISVVTHDAPEFADSVREQFAARDISVVEGRAESIVVTDDQLSGVQLADGQLVPAEAVVVAPRPAPRGEPVEALGLETADAVVEGIVIGSAVVADASGATSVPGVYAAGNLASVKEQVITSAASGLMVASIMNMDLIMEDTQRAVEAVRTGPAKPRAS